MSWDFLLWMCVFIIQAALMGRAMFCVSLAALCGTLHGVLPLSQRACGHAGSPAAAQPPTPARTLLGRRLTYAAVSLRAPMQLICLTELEADFINPYELSAKLNRFVVRWQTRLHAPCGHVG